MCLRTWSIYTDEFFTLAEQRLIVTYLNLCLTIGYLGFNMMITKCNDESLWLSTKIYELFNSENKTDQFLHNYVSFKLFHVSLCVFQQRDCSRSWRSTGQRLKQSGKSASRRLLKPRWDVVLYVIFPSVHSSTNSFVDVTFVMMHKNNIQNAMKTSNHQDLWCLLPTFLSFTSVA